MYPTYRPLDVMNEYAITFFSLLNEGYKLKYRHYTMLAQLISIPHMKDEHRNKLMKQLEFASSDPDDILKTDVQSNDGMADLKEMFRKL